MDQTLPTEVKIAVSRLLVDSFRLSADARELKRVSVPLCHFKFIAKLGDETITHLRRVVDTTRNTGTQTALRAVYDMGEDSLLPFTLTIGPSSDSGTSGQSP